MWDSTVDKLCRGLCRAFPHRTRRIPRIDGEGVLLTQFVIIPDALFLQHFHCPDQELPHNHRWGYMRSFVLSGWYAEWRFKRTPSGEIVRAQIIHHRSPSTFTMNKGTVHRVTAWSRYCWTLFYVADTYSHYDMDTRELVAEWGYFQKDGKYIPWHQAIPTHLRIPSVK